MGFVFVIGCRQALRMRRAGPILSLVFLTLAFAPARASVVLALSVEELTRRADFVVLGEVVSVQTNWSSDHRHIYRHVVVRADEVWKGPLARGEEIALVVPGGELEGISENVVGEPTFVAGGHGAFFLEPAGNTHRLIGLSQGILRELGTRPGPAHRGPGAGASERRWLSDRGARGPRCKRRPPSRSRRCGLRVRGAVQAPDAVSR